MWPSCKLRTWGYCLLLPVSSSVSAAQTEADYWRIHTLPVPEGIVLEVSGIAMLDDGSALVCTRRGEVWVIDHPLSENPDEIGYTLYTEGLQEPLGLLVHGEWIYTVQRGELSRMRDEDGDRRMDRLETVCDRWRVGGNYHEYNFGPTLDADGNFWITTNRAFGDNPFGDQPWRGFALRITPEGEMLPTCAGLRSPAGVGTSPTGDIFYTDNQGEWCGASKLAQLEPGDFHGHPWGIFSCRLPEWPYPYPGDPKSGVPMPQVSTYLPSFKLPAVWFPYDKMGKSPAGFVWDQSQGKFGPFSGQLFVADQHHASVMRVALERVNGRWQGACFPFRSGFQCGIIRLAWGADQSLFCGESNRGWGSRGSRTEGLERLIWSGKTPFEVHSIAVRPKGFRIHLTQALSIESLESLQAKLRLQSYTYNHHEEYGSPEMDVLELHGTIGAVAPDRRSFELAVDVLRSGYVHEFHMEGLTNEAGEPLLHREAYYTLIEQPRE